MSTSSLSFGGATTTLPSYNQMPAPQQASASAGAVTLGVNFGQRVVPAGVSNGSHQPAPVLDLEQSAFGFAARLGQVKSNQSRGSAAEGAV
jgi:hypothetical protein